MPERERTKIDRTIDSEEIFIRCLLKPLMKKGQCKLNQTAVLPPPNGDVVSILRLRYISEDDAVAHGQSLVVRGNSFWGIAKITYDAVDETNALAQENESRADGMDGPNGIQATIIASPMINGKDYVPDGVEVYLDDKSISFPLHAHAELKYNNCNNEEVKTRIRAYANQLIKRISYKLANDDGDFSDWISEK